jgi:hypothetical protein
MIGVSHHVNPYIYLLLHGNYVILGVTRLGHVSM